MNEIDSILSKFLNDTLRVLRAQNFFISSSIAGLKGHSQIEVSYNKFNEAVASDYEDGFGYISAQLFITLISSFEVFLQGIAAAVVMKNPKKLGDIQFQLKQIIDASSIDELIEKAIDEHLNKIAYKRPREFIEAICDLLSIDSKALNNLWPIYIEAKARRDLGVHSSWKCNQIYLRKVEEIGYQTELKLGDSAVPDDDKYIKPVGDKLITLAEKIVELTKNKHNSK